MNEPQTESAEGKEAVARWQSAAPNLAVRSSLFRYYIHDTAEALRLELLGELTDADVPDLSGCWRTAKTTLGSRRLVLDLRALKLADDAGKQWLARMADEGATYLPDTYLRSGLAGQNLSSHESGNSTVKLGLFGRLLSIFRGSSIAPAD
jgi:hypothetical protein